MSVRAHRRMSLAILVGFALVFAASARAETRVLFVGNSLTYFHGVPYLFAAMSEDLYDRDVVVHSLLQPGGWLVQVLEQESTLDQLGDLPYDVVILQENGGALFCGSTESGRTTERCLESIAAHRAIVDAAGHSETIAVLLGTHRPEPIPEASEALASGEAWVRGEAGLDLHVPLAPAFFRGRSTFPELPWVDEDGGHPGSATAILSACMTTKYLFGEERNPLSRLSHFEPLRTPVEPMSFENLISDLSTFHEGASSSWSADDIARIFELCQEA